MFFIIDRLMISTIILLGLIILLIIFDRQHITDKELLIAAPAKKRSFLFAFFRNMADFFNYIVPGIFGKVLSLFIMTTLFFILTFFNLSPGARFWIALLSGLFISFLYLSYRSWLSGQQKKLLYSHWNVLGKKGHYTSGKLPHMGEVVLALEEKIHVSIPAGLYTLERAERTPVVVRTMTGAGSLIVEAESGDGESFEGNLLYGAGGLPAALKNAWAVVKNTFLSIK